MSKKPEDEWDNSKKEAVAAQIAAASEEKINVRASM
jgi:hypothetical protein